jgi:hypothetical protein
MEGYVPHTELAAEQSRAAAAERRAASLAQQLDALQAQLAREKAQVRVGLGVVHYTPECVPIACSSRFSKEWHVFLLVG